VKRLTEDELHQLAGALKKKIRQAQAVGMDEDEDWDPVLQIVVDTEMVVSGVLPLSAFTTDEVVEVGPESPLFKGEPEDPYLRESGT
jgi:hypothetical protein